MADQPWKGFSTMLSFEAITPALLILIFLGRTGKVGLVFGWEAKQR